MAKDNKALKIAVGILVVLLIFSILDDNNPNVDSYKEEIQNLTTQIEDLEQQLKWEKQELSNCQERINEDDYDMPNFSDY